MSEYYCFECARKDVHVQPFDPNQSQPNAYQLDKFLKHTQPSGNYAINSVFDSSDWPKYKGYMVAASQSGCLEIDDKGRKNLLFYANQSTGLTFENGTFRTDCSGVKLVLTEESGRLHAFPSSFQPESARCKKCGRLVPVDHYKAQPPSSGAV